MLLIYGNGSAGYSVMVVLQLAKAFIILGSPIVFTFITIITSFVKNKIWNLPHHWKIKDRKPHCWVLLRHVSVYQARIICLGKVIGCDNDQNKPCLHENLWRRYTNGHVVKQAANTTFSQSKHMRYKLLVRKNNVRTYSLPQIGDLLLQQRKLKISISTIIGNEQHYYRTYQSGGYKQKSSCWIQSALRSFGLFFPDRMT